MHKIPEEIEHLPAGATVVNLNRNWYDNFALAGRRLETRVIPSWELPRSDLESFLRMLRPQIVVAVPPDGARAEPLPGIDLPALGYERIPAGSGIGHGFWRRRVDSGDAADSGWRDRSAVLGPSCQHLVTHVIM
jgi:hypothetical protein